MFRFKLLFIFLFPVLVLAYVNPGKPSGFVNDFAGILINDQKTALENKLVSFESESGNEIAVVTIPNLGGDTIENFAVKLFEDWKIGKKGKDNGILVLIAKDDKKIKIETGYGLEGALTDAQSFWIIDKIMKPAFQQENYEQGIEEAVDKIIAATKGEKIPEEDTGNKWVYCLISMFPGHIEQAKKKEQFLGGLAEEAAGEEGVQEADSAVLEEAGLAEEEVQGGGNRLTMSI